jgi:glycine hydroxymethyltransferase
LVDLRVEYLPFRAERYNIDVDATIDLIRKAHPRAVILGSSNFLFPHPVQEIAEVIHREFPETTLIYDGSHVMGFLAAGGFQDPLREGADLVFGSTHKTFPGPQGGIIFSNRDDLMEAVCAATYPALVTNHHLFRIPALAIAMVEMQRWGAAYGKAIVENAQALGEALEAHGVPCVCVEGRYTQSHTILACVSSFGKGADLAGRLEACGIICTAAHLPAYWGSEGLRIGLQEVTRLGAIPGQMARVAQWIAEGLQGSRPAEDIARETAGYAASLGPVQFTWME